MGKMAIIGAGLSGLLVANELKDYFDITIFEKSRSVGGRLATRYAGPYEFDHGAQFFCANNKDFISFANNLLVKGVIEKWHAKFAEFDGDKINTTRYWNGSYPHYVGIPKMNSIAKYLAQDLNIKLNTKIVKVNKQNNKWQLFSSEDGYYDNFDWLIIAIPLAQAEEFISLYSNDIKEIKDIKMSSCYALMLGFTKQLDLTFDIALVKNTDISLISVNSTKPKRNSDFSMIVLSTNKWADANIDQDNSFVMNHLLKEASYVLKKSVRDAEHIDLHKWRYANSSQVNISPLVYQNIQLAFCGDWAVRGTLQGAFLSATNITKEFKKNIIKLYGTNQD